MKQITKLFVLLFLMMSSSSAKAIYHPYLYPCVYEDNWSFITVLGIDIDPTTKTLVIPNKINGEWVEKIENREFYWYQKGKKGERTTKFSPFKYNCPKDEWGYYCPNLYVDREHSYTSQPTNLEALGEELSLEEIVLPYQVGAIWNHVYFRNLPSLKKIYLRAGYIGDFMVDLTGCISLEEIHLMCWNVPRFSIDGSKMPVNLLHPGQKIKLYVPANKYTAYLESDTRWANNPYFELVKEPEFPTDEILTIRFAHPKLKVSVGNINMHGYEEEERVETFKFPKYYMPLCKVSFEGKGEVKVKLNGEYVDDCIDQMSPLDLALGENVLETEVTTFSEVTFKSNGNGSTVKWNGKEILGTSGGTHKVSNVRSDVTDNSFEVYYNSNNQNLVVMNGSNYLTPISNENGKAVFQLGRVPIDLNYDIQVTDKPCVITVNKTNVNGSLKIQRQIDGKTYYSYLLDGMSCTAGQGTALWFEAPANTHLTTAKIENVNGTLLPTSNGVERYKFIVSNSPTATLTLVGEEVTTSHDDYSLQTFTKIGNGTVRYNTWYIDNHGERIDASGELNTPVGTVLAPVGDCGEGCNGWSITITPDPGYELTTLFGAWDANLTVNDVKVPNLVDMLSEHALFDNVTETSYPNGNGPTAAQKLAEGGDFSLDLEAGRTLSYNASTRTWTFEVGTMEWDHISMSITIGFSNPNETNQKQMSVVAVGQPTLVVDFEYELNSNPDIYLHEQLTSSGSFTKRYQLGDFKNINFVMDYEEGREIMANSGQVTIPFTVYHNGEDATNEFYYDDGQILCDLYEETMEGTWTFIFPDEAQVADAKWSFLKSGEGGLICEVVPKDASATPTRLAVGNESRILHLKTADTQEAIVKVQPAEANTFKAYCNGSDVTDDFTLNGDEYTFTTNQADLRDANWTVLFTNDDEYFTYQFSQTSGGEVLVGVVPVGESGDETDVTENAIEDGSMTLRLKGDEAAGIRLVVTPDENMAVRIYQGDTDVTSQFAYDSEDNSYMLQTSSLANESMLFVFADKTELGLSDGITWTAKVIGDINDKTYVAFTIDGGDVLDMDFNGLTTQGAARTFKPADISNGDISVGINVKQGQKVRLLFNGDDITNLLTKNSRTDGIDEYHITGTTTTLSQFLVDGLWLFEIENDGDVNGDGKIDIVDVTTLVNKILGK